MMMMMQLLSLSPPNNLTSILPRFSLPLHKSQSVIIIIIIIIIPFF